MDPNKKWFRQWKREIKEHGRHSERARMKQALKDNPEEAHWDEIDYGRNTTEYLNGNDFDPSRKGHQERKPKNEPYNPEQYQ